MKFFTVFYIVFLLMTTIRAKSDNLQNVALKKPSIGKDISWEPNDGDEKDCESMWSGYYNNLWWIVDLENYYEIEAVKIYKQDNYLEQHPFEKFYIYVSEKNPYLYDKWLKDDTFLGDICLYREDPIPSLEWNYLPCNQSVTGRFVTWFMPNFHDYLYVCEIEVLVNETSLPLDPGNNIIWDHSVPFEVFEGKKSAYSYISIYFSDILARPHPSLCAVTCIDTNPNWFQGRARVAQLNTKSGVCECILIGSFEDGSQMLYCDPDWYAMVLDFHQEFVH